MAVSGRAPAPGRGGEPTETTSGPLGSHRERHERVRAKASAVVPVAPPRVAPTSSLLPRPPAPRPLLRGPEPAGPEEELGDGGADEDRRLRVGGGGRVPPPTGLGARLQRTSVPELFLAITTPDRPDGGLLVEDDVDGLVTGQQRKRDFLRALRAEVRRVADEELRRVGRSAADCPYIETMLERYDRRSAAETERAVRRYAPESRGVREAQAYLPFVAARLALGIRRWAETGRLPDDLPSDELMSLGSAGGWVGAIAGLAGLRAPEAGATGGGARGAASGTAAAAGPQRQALGPSPGRVDGEALMARLGPGRPLDGTTRARMEAGLGHDFGAVRIHADDDAATLNRDLAARAFTIGEHVVLGSGAPAAGTVAGDALLAHELAHVVQQGTSAAVGDVPVGAADDPLEREADDAAEAVVRGLHAPDRTPRRAALGPRRVRGGLRLQRCGSSYHARSPADLERALPQIARLRDRYHVTFSEESSNWSADELDRVGAALALLEKDPRELAAIRDAVFVRVATPSVSRGRDAQAAYVSSAARVDGTPVRSRRMEIGDGVFHLAGDRLVRLIVHELGHGIEQAAFHDAVYDGMLAEAQLDPASTALQAATAAFINAFNPVIQKAYPATPQAVAFLGAMNAGGQAFVALKKMVGATRATRTTDQGKLETDLTKALTDRDTAWAALQVATPPSPVIVDFGTVIPLMDTAVAALRAMLAAIARKDAADDGAANVAVTRDGVERSTRLARFGEVVDRENIQTLHWSGYNTDYVAEVRKGRSGESHATKVFHFHQEMFAEAYAMWKTDRLMLYNQAPTLAKFFDDGEHLR